MKNPPNSSEQALEDYFNDLLSEPAAPKSTAAVDVSGDLIAPEELLPPMPPLRSIALPSISPANISSTNIAPTNLAPANMSRLAQRPARGPAPVSPIASAIGATPLRAYAEPVRTLNLRMPLPSPAPAVRPVREVPAAEQPRPAPVARAEPPSEPPPEPAAPAPVVEQPAPVEVAVAQPEPAAPAAWLANGRPAWAQRPFECLLFRVGGLGLAAPLAELGSIYKLEPDALTAIFGQAQWFMGLLPVKGYNVRTIDAAQVVMPERYTPDMREDYRYVISLHGSDWGLAVDGVADSVMLHPDDVRWRGQRGKRPWLAGTVVDRMCALLDVAQLVWMFEGQDGRRGTPRA